MDNKKTVAVLRRIVLTPTFRWVALAPILFLIHLLYIGICSLLPYYYRHNNTFVFSDTSQGIISMYVVVILSIAETWTFIKIGTLVAPKKKRITSRILAMLKIIGALSAVGQAKLLFPDSTLLYWTLVVQAIPCIITAILCIHKGKDSDDLVRTTPFNTPPKRETQIEIKEPPRVKTPILDSDEQEKDSVVGNILIGIMILLFIVCGCFAIADAIR